MSESGDHGAAPAETGGAQIGAAIDIGTNSIKLIVASLDSTGATRRYERVMITRLGEGMRAQELRLREAPMRRTLDALAEMVKEAREHGASRIVAVGTAALRDAANRDEFLRRAREQHAPDFDIEVIAGEEEARLSFLAVRRDTHWRNCERLLVIDVGGGSTEIIQGRAHSDEIAARGSVPLGAVRLTENYLKSDPPTIMQLSIAYQAARSGFETLAIPQGGERFTVVGVGGTVTTLASMDMQRDDDPDALHGRQLTSDRLEQMIERLAISTVAQRKEMAGLDPQRADIILGGAILLLQALACIGGNELSVSTRGLRWGVLYDRFVR